MAKGGLMAIIGGPPGEGSDSKEKESTPKGRALKAMWEALESGDFEEAGAQFQTAYDLCAEHSSEEPLTEEEDETESALTG